MPISVVLGIPFLITNFLCQTSEFWEKQASIICNSYYVYYYINIDVERLNLNIITLNKP